MFIRGTTPTHTFQLPFHTVNVSNAQVIYAQNDVEVFHKDLWELELDGNEIRVTLAQGDTLKLNQMFNVQIQLRVVTNDGDSLATMPYVVSVQKCLNSEVL